MGQHDVAFAHALVIGPHIVRIRTETVGAGGEGRQHHVEEIGTAREHAQGVVGPAFHHHPAARQVVAGSGRDEGHPDALAAGGRDIGHLVETGGVALQVIEFGQGLCAAGEARIDGHVLNAFAVHPQFAPVAQALQHLISVSNAHEYPRLITKSFAALRSRRG